MFIVLSWYELFRLEVLCIFGFVNWFFLFFVFGGWFSDNVGWCFGGFIRYCFELIILWIIDRFKKKKNIGRKNRFGFDKCVLICCRIYVML